MKSQIRLLAPRILILLCSAAFIACSIDGEEPCTDNCPGDIDKSNEINIIISGLNYDPNELLNVQNISGGSKSREIINDKTDNSPPKLGVEQTCRTTDYSMATNFDDVAILRPTNGIVYPGALVIGNSGMLDGLPDPLTLKRAPVTLRVDLPGIGANGTIVIDNPSNSDVQTGIDKALEHWNNTAYQEGYVNAANSSYQATTSYSSQQMSLDVGLNVEWASGAVSAQFDYSSSSEKRVAMMVFKQVFYTITMDTPENPSSVFAKDVSLPEIQSKLTSETPPAYVQSVSYGRIIMFRMETTEESTDSELEAAFNYAGGIVSASGQLEAKYKSILAKSSITTVTIGGNAAVATDAVNAKNFGDLKPIITGENAVYSKNNPGVPIAYTIRYLKDNTFAKMGYTTEYTAQNCTSKLIDNKRIRYKNDARIWNGTTKTSSRWPGWARVLLVYKRANSNTDIPVDVSYYSNDWSEDVDVNQIINLQPPAGAHDIRVVQEYYFNCFGCYPGWVDREEVTVGTSPQETFVESWYDNNNAKMKIYKTDKFRD
ncbi:thiol-activated cytolysin family protein [Algoriphagus sp. D3-2-R+10]|uniref:thiol-activated cytolysin family protein n=1 Tax=Algoriphagus aurantiacus TaxID=3103948 RepID=UPI002B399472|nr:thiol-activated cytolysin family protein [Algoriphagus sp. D3-2-R+10]MEB2778635.1 thiol-activated cytolysin family protein [Algoriphagus sp. D3-2-R+10]